MSGTVGAADGSAAAAGQVFISYAHDDDAHVDRVRAFWIFLRANGIDAVLDLPAAERRRDWAQWMTRQIRVAARILVIASPAYRERAEGDAGPDTGRGVQWEAGLIRERLYRDQHAGLDLVLPVLLPEGSADDIPLWLRPVSTTHYAVSDYTLDGADTLLRVLTDQPWETVPPLGEQPVLPPRGHGTPPDGQPGPGPGGLRSEIVITARVAKGGGVCSSAWLAGALLCQREGPLPAEVSEVWSALRLPPEIAAERMAAAGRKLAGMLLDARSQEQLAAVLDGLGPAGSADVVLCAEGLLLALPAELIRLAAAGGGETGPLGLMPAVSVARRPAADGQLAAGPTALSGAAPPRLAGPLKILAAVAAPDESKTASQPLDTEAEMQAVLDAIADVTGLRGAQVKILEVASLPAIREALGHDAYHVLHLAAHGSPDSVELEDEDGRSAPVTAQELMSALQHAGRAVPLIVLSSCSGGAAGTEAMASGLIARGADRVIAMLGPVHDSYATALARNLYHLLATRPGLSAGLALARARCLAGEEQARDAGSRGAVPQYGLPVLLARAGDGPLVDAAAAAVPLAMATAAPGGGSVRELPMGSLIGRRPELRDAMAALRRTPAGTTRFGACTGVVLTGIGGIGKTALAGRVMTRLRQDGWLIALHEGRWNPTALITAVGHALAEAPGQGDQAALASARDVLSRADVDDGPKLAAVLSLLASCRLLVVLDDFEQNLAPGGRDFLDPATGDVLTALADAPRTGAVLVTCRYPLPGPDRFLASIPVPPLSAAELRRMFLRMPALAALPAADQRLLIRVIGGHPRLIEFTDALLRRGRSSLRHVQDKLRDLARDHHIDTTTAPPLTHAIDQAMILGSADILLQQLLALLTPRQAAILAQAAISRAAMTPADLAYALDPEGTVNGESLHVDIAQLANLTLLAPGPDVLMHPWTAELVTRHAPADPAMHQRALDMRLRRFSQRRGSYEDLLDIPRHLAALHRWNDIAAIASQAADMLPGTLAAVAYLAEIRSLIPSAERAWGIAADLEVQALVRAGDLNAATRLLHNLHHTLETRSAADPANTEWQRDLSVSHERLGNIAVAAGDLEQARARYQDSLNIRTRLAAADPANTEWQRDLSIGHNKLGDITVAAGDLEQARARYQDSLNIRTRLAAADPANTQWQRDLSVSHNKLGDITVAAGDLEQARARYQDSLNIAARLAAADPANTQWQRDLSVSHNKLGDITVAAGDLEQARARYQDSLNIRTRLAAADPANTEWQRDLSVSHNKLGDITVAAGDLEQARARYQDSLNIRTRLAAADPANTEWQRDLSISHERLGDITVAAGDLEQARARHQDSLNIAARLAAADPANTQWQRDLSISHERLGDIAVAAGDLEQARARYQDSLNIAARLAAADPANAQWRADLSALQTKMKYAAEETASP